MEKTEEFDFLNDHSRVFLEMAYRTDRQMELTDYPYTGKNKGVCGDMVEMYLDIDDEYRLRNVLYHIEGCVNTNACANSISYLTEGMSVDDAWQITPQIIIDFLETLPPDNYHCAELAVGAFYKALNTVKPEKKDEP